MNQLRFIKSVIYDLKRDYGRKIILRRITEDSTVDWSSGGTVSDQTEVQYTIERSIPLPRRIVRSFEAMFTKVAGNIDTETLTVLIDGSDIDIDPEVDDRFDLDNEEHTVTKVDYLDSDLGFLLRAKRLEGQ